MLSGYYAFERFCLSEATFTHDYYSREALPIHFLQGEGHSLFNKYLSNFDYLKNVFIKDHFDF